MFSTMFSNFAFFLNESKSIYIYIDFKQHVEVSVPTPKTNEVLIKLEAISINPFDCKIQKGVLRIMRFPRKFPHIPCMTH
jgi:NADPH:quinone reductase-like Zn-dependent oxidoreductase